MKNKRVEVIISNKYDCETLNVEPNTKLKGEYKRWVKLKSDYN